MGNKKRESGKILAVRSRLPKTDQITLVPCPACSGSGRRMLKSRLAEYSQAGCRWCSGTGSVPHQLVVVFRRWTRIRAYSIARGSCVE